MGLDAGSDGYKKKTKAQKQLRAHKLEIENKRQEEEDIEVEERLYAQERGLLWPKSEHEEEWEADRQHWVDEAYKALGKVFKPMPEKPALKKPPPIDREVAREIVDTEDAFEKYEKKHENDEDDLPF